MSIIYFQPPYYSLSRELEKISLNIFSQLPRLAFARQYEYGSA